VIHSDRDANCHECQSRSLRSLCSLSPGHGASSDCGCRRRPADNEGSFWSGYAAADSCQGVVFQHEGWARDQQDHTLKNQDVTSRDTGPQRWKMGKGFVTWNVRSLYRSGLLKAVSRELTKNIFHLFVVQGGVDGTGEELNEQRFIVFICRNKNK